MTSHAVRRRVVHSFSTAVLLCPMTAWAHAGAPTQSALRELPWSDDPLLWTSLLVSLALYVRGSLSVWRSASPALVSVHRRDTACFLAGWLALAFALVSPLHPWGQLLFSAHMAQHEILMVVAAPLLVLGRPLLPFSHALPAGWLRSMGRTLRRPALRPLRWSWRRITQPMPAWILHATALWMWHIPRLFQATLTSELVHFAQHASFFATALLFWWALLRRRSGSMQYGAAILYLFTTAAHSGALGALLTVAQRTYYPAYATTTARWGLTPLEDQQLGGLFMWIPAGTVYAGAALALFLAWIRDAERRSLARESARSKRSAALASGGGVP